MTSPTDPQTSEASSPEEVPASATPVSGGESPEAPTESAPQTSAEEQLPEWEPLTPELVEEEAIRGDIVLRGAIVLLALLFGWTKISESGVLTRIQTGRYLSSHGILPPRVDVFSSSASDHPWINLGWLGDLWLAALHGIGGDRLLTVWTGLLAAVAFWLIGRTSLPGAPTWWSSLAAAGALVAVFPWLVPGPEVLTVLGLAWLFWSLQRAEADPSARLTWRLAPMFWLWSNMAPYAWFGLGILWLYAVAQKLTGKGDNAAALSRNILAAAGVSTVASLIHPFHWHVLEAPFVQFTIEYPEIRQYGTIGPYFAWMWRPITDPSFWEFADVHAITGVCLAVVSLIALLLNASAIKISHILIWLFANGAAAAGGHMLSVAAVVNAVLAGLNGQAWYSRMFRQTYSVAWSELLFSRTGRAITVFGFFAIAYMMVNGALAGPEGRRLGLGFDWRLRTAISSFEKLTKESFDGRPFNTRLEQGDVLIWVGQKPFVDSRVAMYARGPSNLLDLHRATYFAMWPAVENRPEMGRPDIWQETFDRFQITHLYSRLTGDDLASKYRLLLAMMMNTDLRLTQIGAAAAEFYRYEPTQSAELREFVDKQPGTSFVRMAFRGEDEPLASPGPSWPRELTTYDRWLVQPEQSLSEPAQLAQHFAFLADEIPPRMQAAQRPLDAATALRLMAVRNARQAIAEDAEIPTAHSILGRMYSLLDAQEQALMATVGREYSSDLRRNETLAAYYGVLLVSAEKAREHEQLADVLASMGFQDSALFHLKQVEELTGDWTAVPPTHLDYEQRRERNRELSKQLSEHVAQVTEQAKAELERGTDSLSVAQAAIQAGCQKLALETLEATETELVQNPAALLTQYQLMMTVGRMEEAWERIESQSALVSPGTDMESVWRTISAIANIAGNDYSRAAELWASDAKEITQSRVRAALDSIPLQSGVAVKQDLYATTRARVAYGILYTYPDRWSLTQFHQGLLELERGRNSAATTAFKSILDFAPETALRPLVVYYYFLLTGEQLPLEGPGTQIPVWGSMFFEEPANSEPEPPAKTETPVDASPESQDTEPAETAPANAPVGM